MSSLSKVICYIVLGIDWKFHMNHFFHQKPPDFILNQYFPYEHIDYGIFCVRASQNIAFGFVKLEHFIRSWANVKFDLAQPWRCFPRPLSPPATLCSCTAPSPLRGGWPAPPTLLLTLTVGAHVDAGFYGSFQNLPVFSFIEIVLLVFTVVISSS